jgi:hypothetical protein
VREFVKYTVRLDKLCLTMFKVIYWTKWLRKLAGHATNTVELLGYKVRWNDAKLIKDVRIEGGVLIYQLVKMSLWSMSEKS